MNEIAINVENIWKSFPANSDSPGFKEFIIHMMKYLNNRKLFWALKNINFTINKGECVGIIGGNGAGKSTLLTLMLGTMKPAKGTINVSGKKTPLLELGAGFHPDLTGIENIMINGVLLGLTKSEVVDRLQDIIHFSELGDFINMHARTYSSGMYMRLAFSVALYTDPEILLIDEILAVGDESFQNKSRKALMNLIKGGVTTVYVSHDLAAINNICDKVIWLDHGEIKTIGEPKYVTESYVKFVTNQPEHIS